MSKIVIVGPAHPLRGGLATYNERLAKAFQQDGDELEIITFSLQYPSFLFPGKTQYSDEAPPLNLNIKAFINSVNPISWLKTGNYLRQQKPDILIFRFWLPFMGPALGTIARVVARNRHTKIVAITDNVIPHEKRMGDLPFTKYFLQACQGFVTMSKAVLGDLKKLQPTKVKVYHPHPLYDNFGEPLSKLEAQRLLNLNPDYHYILFFGFIRSYKGLDILLKAFASEKLAQYKKLKLIIAGEFYESPEVYNQLITQYQLEDKIIRATDFIPNNQVRQYFCASDLVVQPYKQATQSGVSQIAYHFNKPMVVTNVGGLAELVPDGKAGYVTPVDPEAIAAAIADFYEKDREAFLTEQVSILKKQFSWESMVQTLKQVAAQV
ncbi:glycosyltransferase [Adhaeribacter radiodurans]|uniref:Glycosyltransferase n=1 Tax=Adhaeribacter radiodurans TaxID=2745197 RepID=A0A7L7LBZ3_9BACT|nr:glycosyltransferase [Adhaeribacter radiodurans]QMU30356.1 glycosyltransferase [Adhaeribacter radiodurans]